MKAWSVMGLLFGAAILGTIAISPHVTQRGVELRVDQAQAQVTYGRYRRVNRRAYRAAPGYYGGWVARQRFAGAPQQAIRRGSTPPQGRRLWLQCPLRRLR